VRQAFSAFGYRRWRTRCSWVVALALVWGMLAPRFILAEGAAGKAWVEICRGMGIELVLLDDSLAPGDEPGEEASVALDCPYCRLQASLGPPPAVGPATGPRLANGPVWRAPSRLAVPNHPPWRPTLPRAPPLMPSA
jgi:hypothetical protein